LGFIEQHVDHRTVEGNSLRIFKTTSILVERCLLAAGVMLLTIWVSAQLYGRIGSRFALWQFETARAAAVQNEPSKSAQAIDDVDFSLWAKKRIQAYRDSLLSASDPPLAVLEIAKVRIRVPVFEGTDDLTLNRGVGRISGTAEPGSPGNVGIAGHRDGFFRGLKDIAVGDEVDLVMTTGKATYVVDQIEIVSPADVNVLQPRGAPSLTLVTCYPFYFVGDAPQRFIVHASISTGRPIVGSSSQTTFPSAVKENNN
jgi:sortase A